MMDSIEVSVVIPVYKNEIFLEELYSHLKDVLGQISPHFEIIFVNDGSPDDSWSLIKHLAEKDSRVRGLSFSRNFGQHMAITAGVHETRGNWVVVMDGDLQDVPEEILKLYHKAQEGYDVVFARRFARKDSFLKRISSTLFYKLFDLLVFSKTDPTVANFGMYARKVINNFNQFKEHSRLFPLFIRWMGFKTTYVDVQHAKRSAGKSAYSFSKKINLALDTIVSMSNTPLKYSIKIGFLLAFFSFIYIIILIFKYFALGIPVQGWTSLIVSIYFTSGLLLSMLGILGLYIEKIYVEAKNRPLYIIDERVGARHE